MRTSKIYSYIIVIATCIIKTHPLCKPHRLVLDSVKGANQTWSSILAIVLGSYVSSLTHLDCSTPGIGSEQPEGQLGKAKSFWLYLFSPSSDSSRCEGRAGRHAGGSACRSTDGHLLLDTVSPFPSLFSSDLGRACHCRFSHLSLSWGGHIALLLPRRRHLRACGHRSCLRLADEQRWLHRSDRGSGDPPCWGHGPGNQMAKVRALIQDTPAGMEGIWRADETLVVLPGRVSNVRPLQAV